MTSTEPYKPSSLSEAIENTNAAVQLIEARTLIVPALSRYFGITETEVLSRINAGQVSTRQLDAALSGRIAAND